MASENEYATILWGMRVSTEKGIKGTRPDIIIKEKKTKNFIMIDTRIPSERDASMQEAENFSKHKDLETEVAKMWEMKTSKVPIVMAALGFSKKGLENYVKKLTASLS